MLLLKVNTVTKTIFNPDVPVTLSYYITDELSGNSPHPQIKIFYRPIL